MIVQTLPPLILSRKFTNAVNFQDYTTNYIKQFQTSLNHLRVVQNQFSVILSNQMPTTQLNTLNLIFKSQDPLFTNAVKINTDKNLDNNNYINNLV